MPEVPAAGRGRQPATWKDLSEQQRQLLELRLAHLLEAETGFRSGDPLRPGLGEPNPDYDPALVTLLTDRRRAKAPSWPYCGRGMPEQRPAAGAGQGQLTDAGSLGGSLPAVGRDGLRGRPVAAASAPGTGHRTGP